MSATGSPSQSTPSSRPATPGSLPQDSDMQGKLKTLIGILRKFIGVADIASVRFSLPAQLIEPIPNLEYWNYLDSPDTFTRLGDPDDEFGRCIAVLQFWFTKDLKFIKGRPCKPYNSTLGEFFRCHWDVERPSQTASGETSDAKPLLVSYLTEQTSHHPPVSAFYVECKEKGISAKGYDQISAKFTGTSIKVSPGIHNLGIFINLHNRDDEQWNLTHPAAHLGGFLRGSLSITVQDICFITCPKIGIKVILHYLEEPWVGRSRYKVEGVIFKYDPENDTINRIRDVPEADVKARIDGSWVSQIYYTMAGSREKVLLIDVEPLFPATKVVPSEEEMLPNESRKMWQKVTDAIHARDYARATEEKIAVEEQKRKEAADREAKQEAWKPRFFSVGTPGIPTLTPEGRAVLNAMSVRDYSIPKSNIGSDAGGSE